MFSPRYYKFLKVLTNFSTVLTYNQANQKLNITMINGVMIVKQSTVTNGQSQTGTVKVATKLRQQQSGAKGGPMKVLLIETED